MSTRSGIAQMILGGAEIAAGVFIEGATGGALTPIALLLISSGAGMVLSGLGTIIQGDGTGRGGSVTAQRNPTKPWDVAFGQNKYGGTLIYINQWPEPGKYGGVFGQIGIFGPGPRSSDNPNTFLDLVFVLCSHQVQSIDQVLFDGKKVTIDPTAHYFGKTGPGNPHPTIGGTSYNPASLNKQTTSISRNNGVVTVTCPFDIPELDVGDPILLQDENGAQGLTVNALQGTYVVEQIISRVPGASLTFTVLSGGKNVTVPNGTYTNAGYVTTVYPAWGRNVYVEYLRGNQTLGQTFNGLIGGTPFLGTSGFVNPNLPSSIGPGIPAGGINPWTNYCSLQGIATVFLRLYFDPNYFSAGLPQISFLLHGKNDIYDPRLGDCTGVRSVTLYNAGSGGYKFGDVVNLTTTGVQCEVTITGVDGSGNPTSWQVTQTGYGYTLNQISSTSGGSGSGAQFYITGLCGVSSGVASVTIATGGQSYNLYDILEIGGYYVSGWTYLGPAASPGIVNAGSLGIVMVTGVGAGGSVTSVSLLQGGGGYNIGDGYATVIVGNQVSGTVITAAYNYAYGSGTGCTLNVVTITGPYSSSTYSENAALCIADFMNNPIWGYNAQYVVESSTPAPYNDIGIAALTTAANVCDQQVELAQSVGSPAVFETEDMYDCNGHFDLSLRRGDILQNLLTSCAGRLLYIGGIYSIQPAYWAPVGFPSGNPVVAAIPTVSFNFFTAAAGKPTWKLNVKIRDLFNAVKGTYINPSNKWEASDFPYYAQDSLHNYSGPSQYGGDINLAVDLGQRRFKDIHLPFTISASMAQRIAKIELLRGRNQGAYGIRTGTFPCNMSAYQLVTLDVVDATFPFLGWTGSKLLEVVNMRFKAESREGGAVALGVEVDVQETSSNITDWSPYEELSPEGYQQAVSPAASAVEVVPYPWSPGAVAPLNGDAVFLTGVAGPGTFGMVVVYGADSQGNAIANLQISGLPPINQLYTGLSGPLVQASASSSGGSIPPGTYIIGVSAFDASGNNIPYLDLATVNVGSGEGAATVTVGNGGQNYVAGQGVQLIGGANDCIVTISTTGSNGTVTSIAIANAGNGMAVSTYQTQGGSGTGLTVDVTSLTSAVSTGSIQVIIGAYGPGNDGGDIYVAQQTVNQTQLSTLAGQNELIAKNVFHYQHTLTTGQVSQTLTSFNASTAGGADTLFDHFNIIWQAVIHSGAWAEQVQGVTGTSGSSPGTITIAGNGMTLNQWAGSVLTLLAYYDPAVPVPVLNMPIASSTASAGGFFTLTIGQNADGGQLPSLTTLLNISDLVGILNQWTFTDNSLSYALIANGYYPSGDTDVEAGHVAVVLTGVDAGDIQTIASINNASGPITPSNPATTGDPATTFVLAGNWQSNPATGDVVMICNATVIQQPTKSFQTPNKQGGIVPVALVNVQNLLGQVWLFGVQTATNQGTTAPDFVIPRRALYMFGAGGTRYIAYVAGSPPTNTYTMLSYDGLIVADCSGGNLVYNVLPSGDVINQTFTVSALNNGTYTVTVNAFSGDTLSNGATSWNSGNNAGASLTFRVNG
jgi:hypothetical protein